MNDWFEGEVRFALRGIAEMRGAGEEWRQFSHSSSAEEGLKALKAMRDKMQGPQFGGLTAALLDHLCAEKEGFLKA